MLGDAEYDASVERRRAWYERHGLRSRLIETDEVGGFDSSRIEAVIREKILQ